MSEQPLFVKRAIENKDEVAIQKMAIKGGNKTAENNRVRQEIDRLLVELSSIRRELELLVGQNTKLNDHGDIVPHDNPESVITDLKSREAEIIQRITNLRASLGSYKFGYLEGHEDGHN